MSRPGTAIPVTLVSWTLLVWSTRIGNIWNDAALTDGEKWGRTGLAVSFTVLALGAALALWRRHRSAHVALAALAAWTVAVWVPRAVGIIAGDHDAGFVAVHVVLAAVSCTLAGLTAAGLVRGRERQVNAQDLSG